MNNIVLVGRLVKEVELKKTPNGITYTRFNLACRGKQKNEKGEAHADFFICIAWRENAERLSKYSRKGDLLTVSGFMLSRAFKNEKGDNTTIWEVNAENIEFHGNRMEKGEDNKSSSDPSLKEIDDEDIPF